MLRVYNAIKPVTSFCQVFKVEICEANTTVTWQVDIICQYLGTFVFRGFFMPEYCFLRRCSGIFFFVLKYRKSLWEILRDSKFQNSKVILVRFRAFMIETFERHRWNQNRNTNWNEKKFEGSNPKTSFYFTVFFYFCVCFLLIF